MIGEVCKVQAKPRDQRGVKLGFDRTHCHVAICSFVAAVEIGTAIQKVGGALRRPETHGPPGVELGQQQGRAVYHGGVDNLAAPARLALYKGGQNA